MAFISPPSPFHISLLRPFPLAHFPFLLLEGVVDDEDVFLHGARAPMRRACPRLQAVLLVPALRPTQGKTLCPTQGVCHNLVDGSLLRLPRFLGGAP